MTRDDLLAVCRLVVSSRWQDVAMFADASGHVVVWSGEETAAKRVVDDRGQLLGTSGDTTHAHALLLELEAAKPTWRRELGASEPLTHVQFVPSHFQRSLRCPYSAAARPYPPKSRRATPSMP